MFFEEIKQEKDKEMPPSTFRQRDFNSISIKESTDYELLHGTTEMTAFEEKQSNEDKQSPDRYVKITTCAGEAQLGLSKPKEGEKEKIIFTTSKSADYENASSFSYQKKINQFSAKKVQKEKELQNTFVAKKDSQPNNSAVSMIFNKDISGEKLSAGTLSFNGSKEASKTSAKWLLGMADIKNEKLKEKNLLKERKDLDTKGQTVVDKQLNLNQSIISKKEQYRLSYVNAIKKQTNRIREKTSIDIIDIIKKRQLEEEKQKQKNVNEEKISKGTEKLPKERDALDTKTDMDKEVKSH